MMVSHSTSKDTIVVELCIDIGCGEGWRYLYHLHGLRTAGKVILNILIVFRNVTVLCIGKEDAIAAAVNAAEGVSASGVTIGP